MLTVGAKRGDLGAGVWLRGAYPLCREHNVFPERCAAVVSPPMKHRGQDVEKHEVLSPTTDDGDPQPCLLSQHSRACSEPLGGSEGVGN